MVFSLCWWWLTHRTTGLDLALLGACRSLPSLITCGHRQEKQRHFPLTLTVSFCDEWGRLLASLTSPVFAQFADDGQRCVVVQIKREWLGLVLLGCCFRVHSWVRARCQLDRARSWESSGPQKAKSPEALLLRGFRDTAACRWASDERHSVADLGAIMHYFVNLRK